MSLVSIPPQLPFLDTLAVRLLARDDLADCLVLLPTRRAVRAMAEAFLRASDGRPMLLPRIAAFGALDEAPLALAGGLALAPAVEPAERLSVLARMILAMQGRSGAPRTLDRAWPLAVELARLLDEASRAEIDLAAALPEAAGVGWAQHWEMTLQFLAIVTRAWPAWLAESGRMEAQERARRLLDLQGERWQQTPPAHPVIAAGTTGGIPAVARLLRVVAGLSQGLVVLPGLDCALDDAAWEAVGSLPGGEAHPQASLKRLITSMGATRGDVVEWTGEAVVPEARVAALRLALLPARSLSAWSAAGAVELTGLSLLDAADQQEEAVAIALSLRDAIEVPGARAALVTPDRALAMRVTAELLRFGIVANDSAGEALGQTPQGSFLRLLAAAVAAQLGAALAPVPLLSLLKHPLAAAGMAPGDCRRAARRLERKCLRGASPAPGLDGLLAAGGDESFLGRLGERLAPLLILAGRQVAPSRLLAALLEAGEAMAATDNAAGGERLWGGEEGEALAAHLAGVGAALDGLPAQPAATLPTLLDALLEGASVRGRRALRGRDGVAGEHPRVFIWGLLEARLQAAELIVLGGLNEGVWPPATDPGPWLSRPMRRQVGLPSPEEAVGLAAHDFVMSACAAPVCVLSRPTRRDQAPAVPSRFLTRLAALLAGRGQSVATDHAVAWARALDRPAGAARPVTPPRPCPPVALRPRILSVTEIEKWIVDPYAIYARHVLGLRKLDPLEMSADQIDYGSIVHAGIAAFLKDWPRHLPGDAAARLTACMDTALDEARLRPAIVAWWRPRLARIADWVAGAEAERRSRGPMLQLGSEVTGRWELAAGERGFTLTGRADRIELQPDGAMAVLDYKTGTLPSEKDVAAGHQPQLPLEAAMAEAGAFGPDLAGRAAEFTYWRLSGGHAPGEARTLFGGKPDEAREAARLARDKLIALVELFDDPTRAYLSQPHAGYAPRFPDYAQLARVAEWAAASELE